MISSISYLVQERKGKLQTYLTNNMDTMPPEKQHQLYGAIKELENILELLSSKRNIETQKESPVVNDKNIFRSAGEFLKDLF